MRRWLPVAAGIGVYDLWLISRGGPSLSAEFAAAVRHPVHKWWVLALWGYLSVHLVDGLPEGWDPLGRVADWMAGRGVA